MKLQKQKLTAYFIVLALGFGLFNIPVTKGNFASAGPVSDRISTEISIAQPAALPHVQLVAASATTGCEISNFQSASAPAFGSAIPMDVSLGGSTMAANYLNSPSSCFTLFSGQALTQNSLQVVQLPNLQQVVVYRQSPISLGDGLAPAVPVNEPMILVTVFTSFLAISSRRKIKQAGKKLTRKLLNYNYLSLSQLQVMRC